ncbi:hypothetical protein E8E14_005449 [Neopestalotiopsis sp. 37M]|nr:hypothetical protein E8E14_005449 [Neopestalotiopsis sp. 37M]
MSTQVRFPKYARRSDRNYYGSIDPKYSYKETVSIDGGFKVPFGCQELVVGIPSQLAHHLKSVGVPKKPSSSNDNAVYDTQIRAALTRFIGELDQWGLHRCVLLNIDQEGEEDWRQDAGLGADCDLGEAFQKCLPPVKAFLAWEPNLTTVTRNASLGTTTVTFKDEDEAVLAEVTIQDETFESDESD